MAYKGIEGVLHQLAGLTTNRGTCGAANSYAGTSNLELVHALNVKAGITSPIKMLDLDGICNKLAGTTNWAAEGALNKLAGNTLK